MRRTPPWAGGRTGTREAITCYDGRRGLLYRLIDQPAGGNCTVIERPGARVAIVNCHKGARYNAVDWVKRKCGEAEARVFFGGIVKVYKGPSPWLVLDTQRSDGRWVAWCWRAPAEGFDPLFYREFDTAEAAGAHAKAQSKAASRLSSRALFEGLGR